MSNHYDVELRLLGDEAVSEPVPNLMIGDTVQYFSQDGQAAVEFPDRSPYKETQIGDRQTVTVLKDGSFRGRCFITKDGKKFGWKQDPSPSGADQNVKTP